VLLETIVHPPRAAASRASLLARAASKSTPLNGSTRSTAGVCASEGEGERNVLLETLRAHRDSSLVEDEELDVSR